MWVQYVTVLYMRTTCGSWGLSRACGADRVREVPLQGPYACWECSNGLFWTYVAAV